MGTVMKPALVAMGSFLMVTGLGMVINGVNSALDVALILMTVGAGGIIVLLALD